jgi:hemoglobin
VTEREVFAELGEGGFDRLVAAFYTRAMADDILGPMYRAALSTSGETVEHARERLRDFLIFRFGGVQKYVEQRGHPRLRMRHMPFAIDWRGAERWIALMNAAMDEAGVSTEARTVLEPYFRQTALFMVNREA